MNGSRIVIGAAAALILALGAAGAAGAHWDGDHHGPGMGPGMMGPGVGMHPNDDWHQPVMGIYPDDDWHQPGMGMHPHDWWND